MNLKQAHVRIPAHVPPNPPRESSQSAPTPPDGAPRLLPAPHMHTPRGHNAWSWKPTTRAPVVRGRTGITCSTTFAGGARNPGRCALLRVVFAHMTRPQCSTVCRRSCRAACDSSVQFGWAAVSSRLPTSCVSDTRLKCTQNPPPYWLATWRSQSLRRRVEEMLLAFDVARRLWDARRVACTHAYIFILPASMPLSQEARGARSYDDMCGPGTSS